MLLSNQLILCHSLFLLPLIFLSIKVFFNESSLCIRWSRYWSFSFSISPSNEYSRLINLGLTDLIVQSRGLSRVFSRTTIQKQQFFGNQPSLWSNSHIHTRLLKKRSFDYMDFSGQVLLCFLKHCLCLSQVFFHGEVVLFPVQQVSGRLHITYTFIRFLHMLVLIFKFDIQWFIYFWLL